MLGQGTGVGFRLGLGLGFGLGLGLTLTLALTLARHAHACRVHERVDVEGGALAHAGAPTHQRVAIAAAECAVAERRA